MQLPLRYVLTVSELTMEIKDILETKFPDVWVEGEISNLRIPPSGHIYFTLKDDYSQIRAVLFKTQARRIPFTLEDGLFIICRGKVSLYEKRGEYQLILEEIEPKGIGALQLAFLQLKERLEREGLFSPERKKRLPILPHAIGIITSPTGAVIRDMIQIIHRRFENVRILLYPVRVQGEGAAKEIAEGIEYFNQVKDVDVLIIGRGGGSLEDLWAFNEEVVARAIYNSKIPIISAVGHETDYTISDFVADLRAPTPSAAAELVVRDRSELKNSIYYLWDRLNKEFLRNLQDIRANLNQLKKGLADPKKRIEGYSTRLDNLFNRFNRFILWDFKRKRDKELYLGERLISQSPKQKIKVFRSILGEVLKHLEQNMKHSINMREQKIRVNLGKLDSLSPYSILKRGYSITRRLPDLKILRDVSEVIIGDKVEVKLFKGILFCDIEKKEES